MPKRQRQPGEHERVIEAIEGLSCTDWNALARHAGARIRGLQHIDAAADGEDVVQDVVVKALMDSRTCPLDVDLRAFVINCIKSCANQRSRTAHRHAGKRQEFRYYESRCSEEPDTSDETAVTIVETVKAHLVQDEQAQGVLESMRAEMPPRIARQELGIDKKTYDTARKRIKRRAHHAATIALAGYPNHWFWRASQKHTR